MSEAGFVKLAVLPVGLGPFGFIEPARWAPGRTLLDRVAGLWGRIPPATGAVLAVFGLWSLYFGLFVRLEDWV